MDILNWIALISIVMGFFTAVVIYIDIQMGRYQRMPIMNIAWVLTALFLWPLVLYMYFAHGRANPSHDEHSHKKSSQWVSMYISSTHCASGCSIGDIIGETLIYSLKITIAGSFIWAGFVIDFILALVFGLAFQYFSIKPMEPTLSFNEILKRAFKADFFSLVSFQVGMYVWIFLSTYLYFDQKIDAGSPVFWLMMQIAMTIGMFTTMPVNKWLIRVGIKHSH